MTHEESKITAEKVDQLFENKYFKEHLKEAMKFSNRFKALLAVFGISVFGTIAGGYRYVTQTIDTLDKKVKTVQQESQELLQKQSDAVKRAAEEVAKEAKEAHDRSELIKDQAAVVQGSARLAREVITDLRDDMKANAKSLTAELTNLNNESSELHKAAVLQDKAQKDIEAQQKAIGSAQRDLASTEKELSSRLTETDTAFERIKEVRDKATEISKLKTFEFVTLHSRSRAKLTLRHVRETGEQKLETVGYELTFVTQGLKPPLGVGLVVNTLGGKPASEEMLYADIDAKKEHVPREAYCICDTPFMFTVDNFVQERLIRDFVTLKILDRTESCWLPKNRPRASCSSGE